MRYIKYFLLWCIFLITLTMSGCKTNKHIPKNIILFIADGCGFNHIEAASLYQYGKKGAQVYEQFPVQYAVSTYSADGNLYDPSQAWASFEWVLLKPTDSAAASTAIATGYKTNNGYLSVNSRGQVLETILERAEKLKELQKKDKEEIERQIAYFARHLVKARWELNKAAPDLQEVDEEVFLRARRIHEWSKLVFEDSRAGKK